MARFVLLVFISVLVLILFFLPIPFAVVLHPYKWIQRKEALSNLPLGRFDARMAGNATTQFLFGGQIMSMPYFLNDLWALDTSSMTWALQNLTVTPHSRARYCLGFTSKLLLFGGDGGGSALNDYWEYDGTWNQVNTTSPPPPRCCAASSLVDQDHWVIFGGQNHSQGVLGDCWMLSLSNRSWQQLPSGPSPRRDAAMMNFENSIYLYGGRVGSTYFTDLWKFDFVSWSPVTLYPTPPQQPFVVVPPSFQSNGIFGPESLRLLMTSSLYILNTKEHYWSYLPSDFPSDLSSAYSPAVAAVNGGRDIYAFGGLQNSLPVQNEFVAMFNISALQDILTWSWGIVAGLAVLLGVRGLWVYCFHKRLPVAAEEAFLVNSETSARPPFLLLLYQDTLKYLILLFLFIGAIAIPSLYANLTYGVGPLEFRTSIFASNANALWYLLPDVAYSIVYLIFVGGWFRRRVRKLVGASRREELIAFNTVLVHKDYMAFVLECGPVLRTTPIENDWVRVVFVRSSGKYRLLERCRWYRVVMGWVGLGPAPPRVVDMPPCESDVPPKSRAQRLLWLGQFLCVAVGCLGLYVAALYIAVMKTIVSNGWLLGGITALSSIVFCFYIKWLSTSLAWSLQSRETMAEALCLMLQFSQIGGGYLGVRVWLGLYPAVAMIYGLLLTSIAANVFTTGLTLTWAYFSRGNSAMMKRLTVSPITRWSSLRLVLKTTFLFSTQLPLLLLLCAVCLFIVYICDRVREKCFARWGIVVQHPSYNPAMWGLLVRHHEVMMVGHCIAAAPIYLDAFNSDHTWYAAVAVACVCVQQWSIHTRRAHVGEVDLSVAGIT